MSRLYIKHEIDCDNMSKGHQANETIKATILFGDKDNQKRVIEVEVYWPETDDKDRLPSITINAPEVGVVLMSERMIY